MQGEKDKRGEPEGGKCPFLLYLLVSPLAKKGRKVMETAKEKTEETLRLCINSAVEIIDELTTIVQLLEYEEEQRHER